MTTHNSSLGLGYRHITTMWSETVAGRFPTASTVSTKGVPTPQVLARATVPSVSIDEAFLQPIDEVCVVMNTYDDERLVIFLEISKSGSMATLMGFERNTDFEPLDVSVRQDLFDNAHTMINLKLKIIYILCAS